MIPLFKIRYTYMKRHSFNFALNYVSLGVLMLYICYTYYVETKKQERYLSSDDFRCINYEEYPKNESTRRYISNYMLAIISDDKKTIEEFKQFIKTNNFSQYNISYFNKINEVNF